jgi:hypothetical protein
VDVRDACSRADARVKGLAWTSASGRHAEPVLYSTGFTASASASGRGPTPQRQRVRLCKVSQGVCSCLDAARVLHITRAIAWRAAGSGRSAIVEYKGTGTINGSAGYSFLLTACDAQVNGTCASGSTDSFRIKMWNTSTGTVIYDNAPGSDDPTSSTQAIGGGEIVIHKS